MHRRPGAERAGASTVARGVHRARIARGLPPGCGARRLRRHDPVHGHARCALPEDSVLHHRGAGATRQRARAERVPSDQLLRKEMLPEGEKALGRQDQLGDGQRQRPAAAHHGGDPVGVRSRPHHALQQPSAALRREPRGHERCRRGARQGRGRLLSARQVELQRRQEVDFHAVDHRRRHDRLSQVVVRGGRLAGVPRHLGEVSRGRQEAQGQGPAASARRSATPSATRRRSPIPTCGRGAARRSRPTARRGHQQQGDHRVRQVHDRLLEGRARRGRSRLGRHQQQPRVPLADDLRPRSTAPRSTSSRCATPTSTSPRRARS